MNKKIKTRGGGRVDRYGKGIYNWRGVIFKWIDGKIKITHLFLLMVADIGFIWEDTDIQEGYAETFMPITRDSATAVPVSSAEISGRKKVRVCLYLWQITGAATHEHI